MRFAFTRDVRICALGQGASEVATVPRSARGQAALLLLRRALAVIRVGAEGAHSPSEVRQGIEPRRGVALPLPRLRSGAVERLQEHAEGAPRVLCRVFGWRGAGRAQLLVDRRLPYNRRRSSDGAGGRGGTDRTVARGVALSNGLRRAGGRLPERRRRFVSSGGGAQARGGREHPHFHGRLRRRQVRRIAFRQGGGGTSRRRS